MAVVEGVNREVWGLPRVVHDVGLWLIDGPRHIFDDIDATSDLLSLVQRVEAIFEPVLQIAPVKCLAEAVTAITDFVAARDIVGSLHDLLSGVAAWESPFSQSFPNLLQVASRVAFLVGDIGAVVGWLSSIHVLGEWTKTATAQIVTWGKPFPILDGVGDVSCITGSLLNIADTVRLIVKEFVVERSWSGGRLTMGRLLDHGIDIAYDISGIAASVFANIPGVPAMLATISLAVGSTLSLGKFFKELYWKEDC